MNIAVLGLGYVGTVSAACLAEMGHQVTGVDLDEGKVGAIRAGRSPVIEEGLDDCIASGVAAGRLRATTDAAAAVRGAELSMVCVGTPSRESGGLDLEYVLRVTREIGAALEGTTAPHVVVFRSTMLPGTTEERLLPLLVEASGRTPGRGLGVAVNPEFLREGSSLADFHAPPRTVIGAIDEPSGDAVEALYATLPGPLFRTGLRTAEMVKYADNAFHALKIAFANEVGTICKAHEIDSHDVMRIFCADTKLNISPAYLKPGHAFGGSCLPKDLRALVNHARVVETSVPLLEAVLVSNEVQKRAALAMVLRTHKRRIGIVGLSFKPGTDDLRESPAVELAETLIGKGYELAIYDRNVSLARLVGANRRYIEREIPHLSSLLRGSLDEVCAHAEVIVVTTGDPEFRDLPARLRPDQTLIDLVRLDPRRRSDGTYHGMSW